ncbi:hypothetical protein WOA01_08585 [Methylocystis sp. IM2]|uniref:hypothetical protein n=1 Tax=unclassified Methylocystis TaxID=2625913 RepID=UPI0030F63F07
MASKSDFTPVEWKRLVQSPLLAGYAVSAADPSGFIGLLQEGFAAARMVSEARAQPGDALVKSVAEELSSSGGAPMRARASARSFRAPVSTRSSIARSRLSDRSPPSSTRAPGSMPRRSNPGFSTLRARSRKPGSKIRSSASAVFG